MGEDREVWKTEPDEARWTHAGLACAIMRGPVGAWCGYVGVPADHPTYGLGYYTSSYEVEDVLSGEAARKAPVQAQLNDIRVHGGMTFSGKRFDDNGLHWFGFDCSHAGDYSPGLDRLNDPIIGLGCSTGWGGVIEYRDQAYVTAETNSLAEQLAGLSS